MGAPPCISLFGAPTEVDAGTRGARMGPDALPVARLQPLREASSSACSAKAR